MGQPDPSSNPRLRAAVQAARAQNMPKDNIERAIKKSAEAEGQDYEAMRYEGFGPKGVGVIVETLTNNRNRTASSLRSLFTKYGGNLGEAGSVSFMFHHYGVVIYPLNIGTYDKVFDCAIEAGANDVSKTQDGYEILCAPDDLHNVGLSLETRLGVPKKLGIFWRPKNAMSVPKDVMDDLVDLLQSLDEVDDVQNIYINAFVPDERDG